ncbi:hypothetical protein B5G17_08510 [Bacteroides uniformis]|jgi:hypothetical protein|uniref:Uncharacterized protein n=1 Tax=Bacteroides uniformis TaxID=820 RepID=A0A1Y3VDR9_BACUN|nr:hypothetical protein B5G17_08510 [Bacteroides uniformis]
MVDSLILSCGFTYAVTLLGDIQEGGISFMQFRYLIWQIPVLPEIHHNKIFHLQTDILTLCPTKERRQGAGIVSYGQGLLPG